MEALEDVSRRELHDGRDRLQWWWCLDLLVAFLIGVYASRIFVLNVTTVLTPFREAKRGALRASISTESHWAHFAL
jgi:hypothetical protein